MSRFLKSICLAALCVCQLRATPVAAQQGMYLNTDGTVRAPSNFWTANAGANAAALGLGSAAYVNTSYFDLAGTSAADLTTAETFSSNANNLTSGTVPAARLPVPTASTLGGIESIASVSHQWVSSIDTSGVAHLTQPAYADISGLGTAAQQNTSAFDAAGAAAADLTTAETFTSSGYVPITRTVNGHALSANVVVTAGDLGVTIGSQTEAYSAILDAVAAGGSNSQYFGRNGSGVYGFSTPIGAIASISGTSPVQASTVSGATSISMIANAYDAYGAAAAITPTSLGLVIGTNVQAYAANLTSWAGVVPSSYAILGANTFTGSQSYQAAEVDAPTYVTATTNSQAINIAKSLTIFTLYTGSTQTMTFSGTPSDGQLVRIWMINPNGSAVTESYPAAYSFNSGASASSFTIAANAQEYLEFQYDGTASAWSIRGDPAGISSLTQITSPSASADWIQAQNGSTGANYATHFANFPVAASQLPTPTASTLGGIESITSVSHQWISYIDTSGVPHQSQPGFADITGVAPATTGSSILAANGSGGFANVTVGSGLAYSGGTLSASGSSGTVTSVTFTGDGTVLSSTPSSAVTTSGTVTATLNTAAANTILGNDTGSTAAPAYSSVSNYLDNAFGNAQGDILYRGSSGWTVLTPGSSGQVLATQGASANPHYITVSGTGTSGNPTASIGLAAVNGVASAYMTSDSAPALSQAIVPTWTGLHTFSVTDTSSSGNTHYGAEIAATINQTSTAGFTDLYINRTQTAAGSGTQYLINAAVGGTSKFSVSNAGAVAVSGNFTGYNFYAAAAASIGFSSGTQLYEPSSTNGILEIANYANTSLTRIDLGGTTSSFVALQPSGTTLTIGTADGGDIRGEPDRLRDSHRQRADRVSRLHCGHVADRDHRGHRLRDRLDPDHDGRNRVDVDRRRVLHDSSVL
jgi:hypothetical protein